MTYRMLRFLLLSCAVATTLAAADNPFVGKWKLNQDKSKFTGETMTYEKTGSGEIKCSTGGLSYVFKPDGKERSGFLGETVAWKKTGDHEWQTTHKTKGAVTAVETLTISKDEKNLMDTAKGARPDGTPFQNQATYERTSGGPGLMGTWKSTTFQTNAAPIMELKEYEGDGLTWYSPAEKFTFSAKFDGTPGSVTGPTIPAGASGTLRRTGPLSFELVEIYESKPFWKGTFTLSEDKRTLTAIGSMAGANEPMKAMYERQ